MNKHSKFLFSLMIAAACPLFASVNAQAQDFTWPVDKCSNIVTYYAYRAEHFHRGIDISCEDAHYEILAAAAGDVIDETDSAGKCEYVPSKGTCPSCDSSMGNSITIMHPNGVRTVYMHLEKKYKHKGDKVTCGEAIGKMGTTGCSTGMHLHFTVYVNGSTTDKWTYGHTDDPLNYTVPGRHSCEADNNARGIDMISVLQPQNTDIDGDGTAEICIRGIAGLYCVFPKKSMKDKAIYLDALNDESGWNLPQYYSTIRFGDVNGDGKADVCARSSKEFKCWLSNGSGFNDGGSVPMSDEEGYDAHKYYSTIRLADIDGDGKDDFCARYKDAFRCYPSQGDTFSDTSLAIEELGDEAGTGKPQYYTTIRTADFNGDGIADVCARNSSGWQCWPSNGNSFESPVIGPAWSDADWSEPKFYATIRMPDINGDHKADLCARDKDGVVCHLSTDSGWGDAIRGPEWSEGNGWGYPEHYHTFQFGDLNGDGKEDVCARAVAGLYCYLSNGNGFDTDKRFTIDYFKDDNRGAAPSYYRTIQMGDFNGDQTMDICGRNPGSVYCYTFNGSGFDRVESTNLDDADKWGAPQFASTFRFGGPRPKNCTWGKEVCDGKDNNCNGEIDEGLDCCQPTEEICDQKDNDCDGEIDEDNVCNPETPEQPEVPEVPENPENPEQPEVPEVPENPETPEISDNPDNPSQPENPEQPSASDDEAGPAPENDIAHAEDSCSSHPSSIPAAPTMWLLGLCGMIALYRRRRGNRGIYR